MLSCLSCLRQAVMLSLFILSQARSKHVLRYIENMLTFPANVSVPTDVFDELGCPKFKDVLQFE